MLVAVAIQPFMAFSWEEAPAPARVPDALAGASLAPSPDAGVSSDCTASAPQALRASARTPANAPAARWRELRFFTVVTNLGSVGLSYRKRQASATTDDGKSLK